MPRPLFFPAALALLLTSSGCIAGFGATAGPTLETTGRSFGGEGMAEAFGGIGGEGVRAYGRLALGAGYLGESDAGYGLVQPGLGFELGRDTIAAMDMFASLRLLGGTDTMLRAGGGLSLSVLFPTADTGGEDGHVGVGPRVAFEFVDGEDGEPDRGLFSLSFTVRWTAFDTTGNRWF